MILWRLLLLWRLPRLHEESIDMIFLALMMSCSRRLNLSQLPHFILLHVFVPGMQRTLHTALSDQCRSYHDNNHEMVIVVLKAPRSKPYTQKLLSSSSILFVFLPFTGNLTYFAVLEHYQSDIPTYIECTLWPRALIIAYSSRDLIPALLSTRFPLGFLSSIFQGSRDVGPSWILQACYT